MFKRQISLLLALSIMLQYVPMAAFATNVDNFCDHHLEHTADCGYVEGEIECTYHCDECLSHEESSEEPTEKLAEVVIEAPEEELVDVSLEESTEAPSEESTEGAAEVPRCYCAERCTTDNINEYCDVCNVDCSDCTGEEVAVVYAASGTCGANLTWVLDGDYVLTISGIGPMSNYEEDAPWDSYTSLITALVVEEGVATIGNYAFWNCSAMTEASIADSVEEFGARAFSGCTSLTEITIPDGQDYIYKNTFSGCTSLTAVTIPDSVTTIGDNAFTGSGLTSVTIPNSVIYIQNSAFDGCSNLEEVFVGSGVYTIYEKAFAYCPKLESVWFSGDAPRSGASNVFAFSPVTAYYPAGNATWTESARKAISNDATWVAYCDHNWTDATCTAPKTCIICGATEGDIGGHILDDSSKCTVCGLITGTCGDNLTWVLDDAGTLTISGTGAMESWTNESDIPWIDHRNKIIDVVVENGITSLGHRAFCNCGNLISAEIADSVTSIGSQAFSGCSSLTSITIPDSVTKIAQFTFSGCNRLTEVSFPESITSIGNYAFKGCSSLVRIVIPTGVKIIESYTFENCTNLSTIELHDEITTIESGAFKDCSNLSEIDLPEKLISIGSHALSGCTGLTEIIIPETVTSIGGYAFVNCTNITSIVIPLGVSQINNNTFSGCKSLKSVQLHEKITSIGERAFMNCSNLTQMTVPAGVTTIEDSTFYSCSSLTNIDLPESITYIDDYAFYNCDSLSVIDLPGKITFIGTSAFSSCSGLTSLVIPDSVTTIGDEAFYYCRSLTEVVLPKNITSIGSRLFSNCTSLTRIVIPNGVTSIGMWAFAFCKKLETIVIPDSVMEIGTSAFSSYAPSDVYYGGTAEQWVALGEYVPSATYIHYSCADYENHWASVTREPSCEEMGYTCDRCSCGYDCNLVEIPATGHSYSALVTDPTCLDQGYTTYTCACGDTYVDSYMEAKGHKMGEWLTTLEPTCTEQGSKTRSCQRDDCDHSESQDVEAKGHSYSALVTDPTCLNQGYTTYTCACGDTYVDSYMEAKGHKMGEWLTTLEPTCTEQGSKTRSCQRDDCDHSESQDVEAKGHSHNAEVTDPTCTEQGYTTHTCACGDTYLDSYVDALGHNMGSWETTKDATCTADGAQRRDCSRCNHYETGVIKSKGHIYSAVATAPTCLNQGYTTHSCLNCDDSYVDSQVDALGHDMIVLDDSSAATCTKDGYLHEMCTRCSTSQLILQYATGHSYTTVVTEPGCSSFGYTTNICSKCAEEEILSFEFPLGHDMGDWELITDATCTAAGTQRKDCSRCDEFEIGIIKSKGHSYSAVVTDPTCEKQGYTTHSCSACGDNYVSNYVDALKHDMADWNTIKDATCTEEGSKNRACQRAGCEFEETETIESPGHNHEAVVTNPTCTAKGYTTYTCACGDSYVGAETNATGHNWNAATCAVAKTCKACGVTEGNTLEHSWKTGSGNIAKICKNCGATVEKLSVKKHPKNAYVVAGNDAFFSVEINGEASTYQWQYSTNGGKSWKNYSAETAKTDTVVVDAKTSRDGYLYRCKITDEAGNVVYSDGAKLSIFGITTQPKDAAVKSGASAKFTVKAIGKSLSYQWYWSSDDGATWAASSASSATTTTFKVTGKASYDNRIYKCVLTDSKGNTIESDVVKLRVLTVTADPADVYIVAGKDAEFTVKATGKNISYQWQYSTDDGKTWKTSGAASAVTDTVVVGAKTSRDGYLYRCKITDEAGNVVYSDGAMLSVFGITTQPKDAAVKSGASAKFTVKAIGKSLSYQWYWSSDDGDTWTASGASSATTKTFKVTGKASYDNRIYKCVITDSKGNIIESNVVKLRVLAVEDPADVYIVAGKDAEFAVKATGKNISYQWQYSTNDGDTWKNSGAETATTDTVVVGAKSSRDGYLYRCKITDEAGNVVYSDGAMLSVFGIKTQPKSATVESGASAKFTVKATGEGLTYQWYWSADNGDTWTASGASSATTKTFKVTGKASYNGRMYRCVIKDAYGNEVTSNTVKLTVK